MLNVSLILDPAEEGMLRARAKSLGLSVSAYVRQVVRDSLGRNPEAGHAEILRHFQALVPVLAASVAVAREFTPEARAKFEQSAIARYASELKKGQHKAPEASGSE
jgi:hypothetical protein